MRTVEKKELPHAGHRKRVFEKVKRYGFESFHDYELLEFVLYAAEGRKDTKEYAKKLMDEFGSIKGVFDASRDEIVSLGFNDRFASVIACYKEVVMRYVREANSPGDYIDTPAKAKAYLKALCMGKDVECAYCVYLDASHKVIGHPEKISEGNAYETAIYPEKIAKTASLKKAKYVVIGHNHPSGNLKVSKDDVNMLRSLCYVLGLFHVYIFDAIISCDHEAVSLVELGNIKGNEIHSVHIEEERYY